MNALPRHHRHKLHASLFLHHPLASLTYPSPLVCVHFRRVHTNNFDFFTILPRPLVLDSRYFALPLQDPFLLLLLLLDLIVSLPLSSSSSDPPPLPFSCSVPFLLRFSLLFLHFPCSPLPFFLNYHRTTRIQYDLSLPQTNSNPQKPAINPFHYGTTNILQGSPSSASPLRDMWRRARTPHATHPGLK